MPAPKDPERYAQWIEEMRTRAKEQFRTAPDGHKQCTKCKEIKPLTAEYFWRNGKKGFHSMCIPCRKAYVEEKVSREKKREYSRHYETLPEYKERRKQYRANNQEKEKERHKIYDKAHQEERRLYQKNYAKIHQRKREPNWKNYHKKNIERIYANNRNRRARKKNAPGKHTAQDIRLKLQAQENKCHYCKKELTKYHVDHVIPLSRGGSNDPSNLVITCPTCNLRKGNKTPEEWRRD